MVDNTVATPYLIRPLEWGADVVVHSATKYLGGHGTAIAGVIVDGGTFDFAQHADRFPQYNTPDPSYHGLIYGKDLGVGSALGANLAYILKARVQLLRDLGPAASPFNAFLIAQGHRDAQPADRAARAERHRGRHLARGARRGASRSRTRGSPRSPWKAQADKYAPRGAGAVLAFDIDGGAEAAKRFVDGLTLHSHVANIGDVRSLVIHPASTTHSQLTVEEQAAAGVTPGLVRLAVGLEHLDDILADLEAGFTAAKADLAVADDAASVSQVPVSRRRESRAARPAAALARLARG